VSVMSRVSFCAVIAALVGGGVHLSAQSVDQELRQAIDAREDAFAARDLNRWSKYTADHYRLTTEAGAVRTKADQLRLIRFRGHLPRGGYDVQNAIQSWRPACPATVL
jgi:hypothetical protein